jgi:hypothetical protein
VISVQVLKIDSGTGPRRRTYAKLAPQRAAPGSIRFSSRSANASLTTTERYLSVHQDLNDAPCDYIRLDLSSAD